MNHRPSTLALLAALLLAACAAPAPMPTLLYRLPANPPVDVGPVHVPSGWVWQLVGPVRLPDYLDRDALLLPQGAAGLRPWSGHRWAEPLRDAVPRILRQDLAALLGADRIWTAPLPPGVVITRQIRLEIEAFEPAADGRTVRLRARWALSDPRGHDPVQVEQLDVSVAAKAAAGGPGEQLVAAHRLALWRLAERIAGVPASP